MLLNLYVDMVKSCVVGINTYNVDEKHINFTDEYAKEFFGNANSVYETLEAYSNTTGIFTSIEKSKTDKEIKRTNLTLETYNKFINKNNNLLDKIDNNKTIYNFIKAMLIDIQKNIMTIGGLLKAYNTDLRYIKISEDILTITNLTILNVLNR